MSSSFLPFLGQSATRGVPINPGLTGDLYPEGIPVTAPQTAPPALDGGELNPGGPQAAPNIADLMPKNASAEDLQRSMALGNAPERKGMFGLKGTLRDVLGTLGDAFLVQSGNQAVYRPTREKEKLSDALIGMGPGKERDAIARAMEVNPEFTVKLYQNWQDRMGDEATRDIRRDQLEADAVTDQRAALEKGIRQFSQFAGALAQNPSLAPRLTPIMEKIKADFNLGDEFAIPGAGDADYAEALRYGGTPAQQQLNSEYRDRSLEQKESQFKRAEAGRMARDNPPPRQRNEGASEVDASVLRAVINGTATPAQMKVYNERLVKGQKGRGSGRSPSAPSKPSSTGSRKVIRQGNNLFDAATKQYIGPAN